MNFLYIEINFLSLVFYLKNFFLDTGRENFFYNCEVFFKRRIYFLYNYGFGRFSSENSFERRKKFFLDKYRYSLQHIL